MKIEKHCLKDIPYCYAVQTIKIDGKDSLIFASEAKDGSCYLFSAGQEEKIWDRVGGTMSIVPIPGKPEEFLAVQKFYPGFDSAEAQLIHAVRENGSWKTRVLQKIPYLHRFDLLVSGEDIWFIGCTLCSSKQNPEDWSDPGKILVGKLDKDDLQKLELSVLKDGLVKNHGYGRCHFQGQEVSVIAAENGVFVVKEPTGDTGCWSLQQITDRPASEAVLFDLDEDGQEELILIEPFHGNAFTIWKKAAGGYEQVYAYPGPMNFGHVIWAGTLLGRPAVIGAQRQEAQDLFVIRWDGERYDCQSIDCHQGPSNIAVLHEDGRDIIASANREAGQAVLYFVTE